MSTWKRFAVVGFAVTALLGMSGCATLDDQGSSSAITTYAVSFQDGYTVDCLYSSGRGHGDVNCMWGEPSVATEKLSRLLGSFENAGKTTVRCVADDYGSMDCDTERRVNSAPA